MAIATPQFSLKLFAVGRKRRTHARRGVYYVNTCLFISVERVCRGLMARAGHSHVSYLCANGTSHPTAFWFENNNGNNSTFKKYYFVKEIKKKKRGKRVAFGCLFQSRWVVIAMPLSVRCPAAAPFSFHSTWLFGATSNVSFFSFFFFTVHTDLLLLCMPACLAHLSLDGC